MVNSMKAGPECLECLRKLARQATELATTDPKARSRIERDVAKILKRLSPEVVPPDLSNEFHPIIKELSWNRDPYRERKLREMEAARVAFSKIKPEEDLRRCVEIAAQGNAIDFFVDHKTLLRSLNETPKFAIDHVGILEQKLATAREILYLSDNAGEAFFDLPLVKVLGKHAKVMYAVKEAPIQNDLTLEDLRRAGLSDSFDGIIEAPATIGIYLEKASPQFRAKFDRANLVVAKGMGNYETLSELPESGKIFYILRAKCGPVARSLGVNVDDYVAVLR
jgi:uncharacterized protein with ATP-grasp and redox domains